MHVLAPRRWTQLRTTLKHCGSAIYITLHYITLLCGTRSLMAMESHAIAGGLSADHQLPGVPNAEEVLLNGVPLGGAI
jgi:hypothetical protein